MNRRPAPSGDTARRCAPAPDTSRLTYHPAAVTLSEAQNTALAVFAGQYRAAVAATSGLRRTIAADGLRKAAAVLNKPETAIVTMVAINGNSLTEVAAKARRSRDELVTMLAEAAAKLADPYEATGG